MTNLGRIALAVSFAALAGACHPPPGPPVGSSPTVAVAGPCRLARSDRSVASLGSLSDPDAWRATEQFYDTRSDHATWWHEDTLGPQARHLLSSIRDARRLDGLDPSAYGAAEFEALLAGIGPPPVNQRERCLIDLALTYRLALYVTHLTRGRIAASHVQFPFQTDLPVPDVNVTPLLERALSGGEINEVLAWSRPHHPWYGLLVTELSRYRALADGGGWQEVPMGATLKPDDLTDPRRTRALERRLEREGYLERQPMIRAPTADDGRLLRYDRTLVEAVRRFQEHHGLEPDGVLGPRTLSALNVSPADRIRSMETTLDHLRWLPRNPDGELTVVVNVPAFELHAVQQREVTLRLRAIVGNTTWNTPLVSSAIDAITLNPEWNVPASITRLEMVDKIRTEPDYLGQQHIVVLDVRTGAPLDPQRIDWDAVAAGHTGVRLRQAPGPWNSLGRVKFSFPSGFGIYLHGTNAPTLFDEPQRALSHGCLRLDRPLELVELLEHHLPAGWSVERLRAVVDGGDQHTVRLEPTVPIHVVYWTATPAPDGSVAFHDDVYGVEPAVRLALEGMVN